jgi:hypothetical protein
VGAMHLASSIHGILPYQLYTSNGVTKEPGTNTLVLASAGPYMQFWELCRYYLVDVRLGLPIVRSIIILSLKVSSDH